MINLHESMGPGRDRTRDPWIYSQLASVARQVTDCATRPGDDDDNDDDNVDGDDNVYK